jgi:hypothetical protein
MINFCYDSTKITCVECKYKNHQECRSLRMDEFYANCKCYNIAPEIHVEKEILELFLGTE